MRAAGLREVVTGWAALLGMGLLGMGPSAACAAEPAPLKVAICLGPGKPQLAKFAARLEERYFVKVQFVEALKSEPKKGEAAVESPFSGLAGLEECDVIISNLYRTWAPPAQLETIQKHFQTKPVVGLRKAHHGFQNWLGADQAVFGVTYKGHYFGKDVKQQVAAGREDDALLAGLELAPLLPAGGLYGYANVQPDVQVLLSGGPADKPPMPQHWKRVSAATGQRTVYTRYDPQDLAHEPVQQFVIRSLFWAANRDPERMKRP